MQEMQETRVQSLDQEDALEEGMAALWYPCLEKDRQELTEELGRLQPIGLQRVRHY